MLLPMMIGPPIPGAPWTPFLFGPRPAGVRTPVTTTSTTPPASPGRGKSRPNIPRVPDPTDSRRLSRMTEQLHSFVNSLIEQGVLVQTAAAGWSLRPGGFSQARPPAATDDLTAGVVVGATWVDTAAHEVYVCASNAQGAAVWKQVS